MYLPTKVPTHGDITIPLVSRSAPLKAILDPVNPKGSKIVPMRLPKVWNTPIIIAKTLRRIR